MTGVLGHDFCIVEALLTSDNTLPLAASSLMSLFLAVVTRRWRVEAGAYFTLNAVSSSCPRVPSMSPPPVHVDTSMRSSCKGNDKGWKLISEPSADIHQTLV